MKPFAYHQPDQIPDAAKLLIAIEDSKLVAGGMTLIPTLKQRLASPTALVDLSRLGSLKGITDDGATITIGAMTPHAVVAASKLVQAKIPGLFVPARLHARCKPLRYSNQRIKQVLGWTPRYSLIEALERSIGKTGEVHDF